jgi:hypothetical protein
MIVPIQMHISNLPLSIQLCQIDEMTRCRVYNVSIQYLENDERKEKSRCQIKQIHFIRVCDASNSSIF